MDYLVNSVNQYYKRLSETNKVQTRLLLFFKTLARKAPLEYAEMYKQLYNDLIILEKDLYEKRAFLYLDATSWVEAKIRNRSIAEIIQQKNSE